jgi:hypothetical protein
LLGSFVSHEVVAASCGGCCFVEDILRVVSGIEYVWEGREFTPASMLSTQTAFWWRSARALLGLVVVGKGEGETGENVKYTFRSMKMRKEVLRRRPSFCWLVMVERNLD